MIDDRHENVLFVGYETFCTIRTIRRARLVNFGLSDARAHNPNMVRSAFSSLLFRQKTNKQQNNV